MSKYSLSQALAYVAADLDQHLYPFAGVVRRAAREIAAIETREKTLNPCPECGEPLARGVRGRPRVYCSTRCRRAAEKARRNGSVFSKEVRA